MTTVGNSRIDALFDPAFAADLGSLSMEEVRAKRAQCQEIESALSYLRRMAQGRLDIVMADAQRRRDGGDDDPAGLVDRLKDILSDKVHAPGLGRLATQFDPGPISDELQSELDDVADPGTLSSLSDLSDAETEALAQKLSELERSVSARRRKLHELIDLFQDEIVRRYKSGEATVDSLLS